MIKGFTLSLEIFSGEKSLGSLIESVVFFVMALYARSYDIYKCYTQVSTAGDFLYASLNVWVEDMMNFKNLLFVLRDYLRFANLVAGWIA